MKRAEHLRLGQKVQFSSADVLARRRPVPGTRAWVSLREQYPRPGEIDKFRLETHEGVVVGVRQYANGTVKNYGFEEPTVFTATQRFPVVLVATHLRRNHAVLRPEDLTLLD